MKIKSIIGAIAAIFAITAISHAATIVTYNMGAGLGAATQSSGFTGAGAFTTTRGTLASSTISGHAGPNGTAAVTTSNWATVGGTWAISLNLTGWTAATIGDWAQQASGTGPRDFEVFVSYDSGATFTNLVSTYAIINGNSPQPGFALGAAADNNAGVIVQWRNTTTTSVDGGTTATTGTNRFGNFAVSAVPEPSTALLGALGALALLRRRR